MERITVNLADEVGKKVKARADAEKRSASGYIELLIEQDLRAAGLLPAGLSDAEFVAKVTKRVLRKLEKAKRAKVAA